MKFQVFGRFYLLLENVFASIGGATILALMGLTMTDVVFRYGFNAPLQGAFELSEFMMAGAIFLGLAYVQRHRGHVAIDFLVNRLPPAGILSLRLLGYALPLTVFSVITWGTGRLAYDAWRIHDYTSGAANLPTWPARTAVTIGCGLLCVRLVIDAISDVTTFLKPELR